MPIHPTHPVAGLSLAPRRRARHRAWWAVAAASAVAVSLCAATTTRAALGVLAGKKSAYGASTSSYKPANQIRAVADPTPGSGSATIRYDPSVLTLTGVFNRTGYQVDDTNSFIGIFDGETTRAESLFDYSQEGLFGPYAGFVQVRWIPASLITGQQYYTQAGSSATFQPDSLFSPIASAGATSGATPFGLDFTYTGGAPPDTSLTIFADPATYPNFPGGTGPATTSPDYLTDPSDPNGTAIPASDISPATVVAPEPASVGLLGIAALGLLARRRRRTA